MDGSRGLKRGIHVQGNVVSYGNFAVDKFHRLQVSVGSSSIVSNYKECALSCVNNPPCSSFNVASSPRSDGKYRCELLNEDKYSANPGHLVSSSSYHHYSIKSKQHVQLMQLVPLFPTLKGEIKSVISHVEREQDFVDTFSEASRIKAGSYVIMIAPIVSIASIVCNY
ncbi:hypothetical protein ACROYT_G039963 [Oculina patagonica]